MSYATGPEKSPLAAVAEAAAGCNKTQTKSDKASSHPGQSAARPWLKAGTTTPMATLTHLPSLLLKPSSDVTRILPRPSTPASLWPCR